MIDYENSADSHHYDLIILNGRAFNDKNIGKATCKNSSVVDYVISSSAFLKHFSHFTIKEFCELYSDAHASLEFFITWNSKCDIHKNVFANEGKIRPWDETVPSMLISYRA